MMKFWGDGGVPAVLKTSSVQKGDFIKAGGQDAWSGRAAL